jgi:hypothetical protein
MKDDKKTKGKDELGESTVKKDDKKLSSAVSNKKVRELAEAYMKSKGMSMLHPKLTFDVSPERGAKIAKAYEEMKHEPENPKVKKAYNALIQETLDQWNEIRKTGLKTTKITPDMENPYPGGSKDVIKDIAENNHLFYFPTEQGYGSTEVSNHPMLQKVKVDGEEVPANDIFRIVHDYFGHVKEGHGFGPQGEENAWMTHKQMYSPEARKALTSETRGQNSWVNFGPMGEENRKNPAKTTYAEQKAGLMPDWVVDEEPTTGREKMADGGRVYMQEGGNPADMVPETTPTPTSTQMPEAQPPFTLPTATPSVTPMPSAGQPEEQIPQGVTPEIKRTHVPVWDMSGSKPELTEISHDMVQEGIRNGQYAFDKNTKVPVVAPDDGKLYYISAEEAQDAFNQQNPYRYADPKTINEIKYGGAGQTAIAALEAGARGLLSAPLASAIETGLGLATKEEILGREEASPALSKAVETTAFVAPLLLTGGAWAAEKLGAEAIGAGLKGAGQLAAKAPFPAAMEKLGAFVPQGTKWYSKIGYGAARGAFEGVLFQGSEEAGRAYLEDPDQTAGDIMSSLSMGGLLGGLLGFGFSSGAQALKGIKTAEQKLRGVLGGAEEAPLIRPKGEPTAPPSETAAPGNPDDFIRVNAKDVPDYDAGQTTTHVQYDPDIPEPAKQTIFQLLQRPDKDAAFTQYVWEKYVGNKIPDSRIPVSMLSPHPFVHNMEQTLAQKFTGQTIQKNIDNVINAIHDSTTAITGSGQAMSRVDVGEQLMENILSKHEAADAIHARVFNQIRKITQEMPLQQQLIKNAAGEMTAVFNELKTADPATVKFLNDTLKDLQLKTTVDDLKNFATTVRQRADNASGDIRTFGYDLSRIVRNLEGKAIDSFADTPGLSGDDFINFSRLNEERRRINRIFSQNQSKYERLAEILKAKGTPRSFADFSRIFKDLTPEKVTKALEDATYRDKVWLKDPANGFQKEFEMLRKHELNKIVQKAKYSKGTDPRAAMILNQLFGKESDPRTVQLLLKPEEIDTLRELWWLHRKLPPDMNPSGSGARINMNEFLAGLISPKFLVAQFAKSGVEHGMLKATKPKNIIPSSKRPKTFAEGGMVTDSPVPMVPQMTPSIKSPKESFAQAVLQPPQIQQAQKLAEAALKGEKTITNSVKSIFNPSSSYKIPTPLPKNVERVKTYVQQAQEDPSILLNAGHPDFPEMSGSFGRSISSAVNYLGSIQPPAPKALPFDTGVKAPPSAHSDIYNHVLKVTDQPLYILEKVKQGTVIPEEVGAVKTIYPSLYQKLQNQITEHLIEAGSKGAIIPYRTKIGLSAFLGSPIDTTFTPEAIQAAQPQQQNQPPQGAQTGAQPKRSTSALGKMATMAQTPGQARSAERSSGK